MSEETAEAPEPTTFTLPAGSAAYIIYANGDAELAFPNNVDPEAFMSPQQSLLVAFAMRVGEQEWVDELMDWFDVKSYEMNKMAESIIAAEEAAKATEANEG